MPTYHYHPKDTERKRPVCDSGLFITQVSKNYH